MIDRRSEQRLLCADFVDVRWTSADGKHHRVLANLEDISTSGVCLQLDDEIPVGTVVDITHQQGEFSGTVRHSQYREIGYFVGIQFEPGSRWDEHVFKPLHLLDPRTLVKKEPGTTEPGASASAPQS